MMSRFSEHDGPSTAVSFLADNTRVCGRRSGHKRDESECFQRSSHLLLFSSRSRAWETKSSLGAVTIMNQRRRCVLRSCWASQPWLLVLRPDDDDVITAESVNENENFQLIEPYFVIVFN